MILQVFELVDRDIFSEELPVSQRHTAGTVHPNYVLVKLSDLNHLASLVPFSRVGAGLVLDSDSVANHEWWELSCVFRPVLHCFHVAVT